MGEQGKIISPYPFLVPACCAGVIYSQEFCYFAAARLVCSSGLEVSLLTCRPGIIHQLLRSFDLQPTEYTNLFRDTPI